MKKMREGEKEKNLKIKREEDNVKRKLTTVVCFAMENRAIQLLRKMERKRE